MGAVRRRRTGRAPADVRVVAPGAEVEEDVFAGLVKSRGDQGDIRQVGAAGVGGVQGVNVARLDAALVGFDDGLDGLSHGTQMHRHMGGVGHQAAGGVEQGAGEVQPLLDVHRVGGVAQGGAHLLGDGHEQVVEHLQHHRVRVSAHRFGFLPLDIALQQQVAAAIEGAAPAGLQDDGGGGFDDDGRADHALAGTQGAAVVQAGVAPFAAAVDAHGTSIGRRSLRGRGVRLRLKFRIRDADGLHGGRLHNQAAPLGGEAEALPVRLLKVLQHLLRRAGIHQQAGVRAGVAQMHLGDDGDVALRHALIPHFPAGGLRQGVAVFRQLPLQVVGGEVEPQLHFPQGADLGQAHAVGGQHPGEGMQEDAGHA